MPPLALYMYCAPMELDKDEGMAGLKLFVRWLCISMP